MLLWLTQDKGCQTYCTFNDKFHRWNVRLLNSIHTFSRWNPLFRPTKNSPETFTIGLMIKMYYFIFQICPFTQKKLSNYPFILIVLGSNIFPSLIVAFTKLRLIMVKLLFVLQKYNLKLFYTYSREIIDCFIRFLHTLDT